MEWKSVGGEFEAIADLPRPGNDIILRQLVLFSLPPLLLLFVLHIVRSFLSYYSYHSIDHNETSISPSLAGTAAAHSQSLLRTSWLGPQDPQFLASRS